MRLTPAPSRYSEVTVTTSRMGGLWVPQDRPEQFAHWPQVSAGRTLPLQGQILISCYMGSPEPSAWCLHFWGRVIVCVLTCRCTHVCCWAGVCVLTGTCGCGFLFPWSLLTFWVVCLCEFLFQDLELRSIPCFCPNAFLGLEWTVRRVCCQRQLVLWQCSSRGRRSHFCS